MAIFKASKKGNGSGSNPSAGAAYRAVSNVKQPAGYNASPSKSGAGYNVNETNYDYSAGFEGTGRAPKSKLRGMWWKALLAAIPLWYVAEGVYYTSQTDHPDEYKFSGIPGYVIDEVGYDLGDVGLYVASFWDEDPDIPDDRKYVPEWMQDEELKVLFLRPRFVDNSFSEILPGARASQLFELQKQYVMESISDGYKGTKIGNAVAHDRHVIITLASPNDILSRMSNRQRQDLAELPQQDQMAYLARQAVNLMDFDQTSDDAEQRTSRRHNQASEFVVAPQR